MSNKFQKDLLGLPSSTVVETVLVVVFAVVVIVVVVVVVVRVVVFVGDTKRITKPKKY